MVHERAIALASKQKWKKLLDYLESETAVGSKCGKVNTEDTEDSEASAPDDLRRGESALHAACFEHAPMEVVRMIASAFPSSIRQRDVDGQTPLHIAGARGASFAVIKFLLMKFPTVGFVLL